MSWVITPEQACVVIPTAPTGCITTALRRYLAHHKFPNIVEIEPYANGDYDPVVVMRNKVIRDIVLSKDARFSSVEHFVFFDNDLRPDARLDAMFEVEADLVGATYELNKPEAWLRPDSVHCAAMRFHRRVVERIEAPYFMHQYSADGTTLDKCDCIYFRDKVKAAGFTIARAGWSAHGNARSWCH